MFGLIAGPHLAAVSTAYFRFPIAFFGNVVWASPASRFSVRFAAAASDAFLARADRSSGVMVTRLRFPPFDPIAAIASRIMAGVICFPIGQMITP